MLLRLSSLYVLSFSFFCIFTCVLQGCFLTHLTYSLNNMLRNFWENMEDLNEKTIIKIKNIKYGYEKPIFTQIY